MITDYTQHHPATRGTSGEPTYTRASNGTLRGRLIASPKHTFSFTLYLRGAELASFLGEINTLRMTPFAFTWQEDGSTYPACLVTKNNISYDESGFATVTVSVEEV